MYFDKGKKYYVVLYDNGCGDPAIFCKTKQEAIDEAFTLLNEGDIDDFDEVWFYEGYYLGHPEQKEVEINGDDDQNSYTEEQWDEKAITKQLTKKKGFDEFIVANERDGDWADSFSDSGEVIKDIEERYDMADNIYDDELVMFNVKFIGKMHLDIK